MPMRLKSVANATDVPPEGAPVDGAKTSGRHAQASAQIEHDEAVGKGAHLENDLPRVILAEVAALHALPYAPPSPLCPAGDGLH